MSSMVLIAIETVGRIRNEKGSGLIRSGHIIFGSYSKW